MASFLPVLQLFFCFIFSSHALYENISYNDIILNMAELQRIAVQQKDLNNPSNIRPFDDTVLHMISSPWKLLQDGSQIARKLNGMSISADCTTGIADTVQALIKGEGWAGRSKCSCSNYHYRPQTKFAKVMFLQVSVILSTGRACVVARGACMVAPGGRAWLLRGGGVRGCSQGACMVAPEGGHAWLLPGRACVVAPGGHVWFFR